MSDIILPVGFVFKLFGRDGERGNAGEIRAKGKRTVSGVKHPQPVTREGLDYAFAGFSRVVTDAKGKEWKLEGTDAAAQAYWEHSLESLRGKYRDGKWNAERVAAEFAKVTRVKGRQLSGSAPVNESKAEELGMTPELRAYLISQGVQFAGMGKATQILADAIAAADAKAAAESADDSEGIDADDVETEDAE